jgi:hypothetical protein
MATLSERYGSGWSLLSRRRRVGAWVIAGAMLLHGAAHAQAPRGAPAPSGDVFSSSSNCQVVYQQAADRINAQHSQEWPACHGASACIRAANAKKAQALKQEGEKLRLCQARPAESPGPTATPSDRGPGVEKPSREEQDFIDIAIPKPGQPQFKARPPQLDTTRDRWSEVGSDRAVFTDAEGRRWQFRMRVSEAGHTWILQHDRPATLVRIGELREAKAQYREIQNRAGARSLGGQLIR